MGKFFSPNTWQMMTFLNPLDALIPKIPFSLFADFWVWVTSEARGSLLVGFRGSRQLSPPWEGGGGLARGLYRPPPPPSLKSPVAPERSTGLCPEGDAVGWGAVRGKATAVGGLPFQCRPIVCLNTELATGRPEFNCKSVPRGVVPSIAGTWMLLSHGGLEGASRPRPASRVRHTAVTPAQGTHAPPT